MILDHLPYKGEYGNTSVTNVTTNGDTIEATFSNEQLKQNVQIGPGTLEIHIEFLQGERKGTIIQIEERCGIDYSESIHSDEIKDSIRDVKVEINENGTNYGYIYNNEYDNEPDAILDCFFKEENISSSQSLWKRAELSGQKIESINGNSTFAGDINGFIAKLVDSNVEELFMQLDDSKKR